MKNPFRPILIVLAAFASTASGQTSDAEDPARPVVEKLDIYLASANKAYRFNGVALVAGKGKVLFQKAYGVKNAETGERNATDIRFPILSITKSFTAAVILGLQEEGKLNVEDGLSKYFPDYPNGKKIKIRHLLTHSSGIFNYTDPVGIEDSSIVCHPVPKKRILDLFMNVPAEFAPGKHYAYNNSGYFLLGLIIEKVTGKPYETVVREMIFNPLGMNDSGFDFLNLPDKLKARGYQFLDSERSMPYKHFDSTFAYAAGSIYSTLGDMYKWAKGISDKKILTPESWKVAFTPKINNYGYGWQTGELFGRKYVKHSGGYPGYMSEFVYYPGEDLTIILLCNFGNYEQTIWPVGVGISCIVFDLPYDNWKPREECKLTKEILAQYTGTYSLNNKQRLVIRLNGDRLFAIVNGLPEMALYPRDASRFYLENFNTEYVFANEGQAGGPKLTVHEHGQDFEFIRIR